MRLEVIQVQGNGFTRVAAVHNNQRLTFSTKTYGKIKLANPEAVFDEINGYWSYLPEEAQEAIWNIYAEVKEYLDNVLDSFDVVRIIRNYVNQLYQYMSMDTFSHWLLVRGNLYIPSDIQDVISDEARYPRIDQTYLKEDYINLAALAIALRPMLPIWGEFIDPERQGSTDEMYKEMEAISLIRETELFHWPHHKPAFEKLQNYIRITVEENVVSLGMVWKGIGTAELPLWLQSKVMVRRMPIVPLCDYNSPHSLIANIYNYVQSNLKPTERRTSDRVTEKTSNDNTADEDDKTSFLEGYKVKQRVPTGDAVLFNVYSENMVGILLDVDPTANIELLHQTTQMLDKMASLQIHTHQIYLAQWILAKAYPPRAFYHINKVSVNRLLAVTQALLWHWGFLDVACFVQVERISSTLQEVPGITQRPRGGSRIARKYDNELMELYPHTKPQKANLKARDVSIDSINRSSNFAAIGINTLTHEIHRYDWFYHGPEQLKALTTQPEGRGILMVPPKFKDQVTELVIHLAKVNRC